MTSTTIDTSTGATVSVPTKDVSDVADFFSASTQPVATGSADQAAVLLPLTQSASDTATSDVLDGPFPDVSASASTLDPNTGLLVAPNSNIAPSVFRTQVRPPATMHYANPTNTAGWASAMAYSSNTWGFSDDDCTDFASRAIHFGGGLAETGGNSHLDPSNSAWYFKSSPVLGHGGIFSRTWSAAKYNAMWQQLQAPLSSQPAVGEIVYASWNGGRTLASIDHVGIVTKIVGKNFYLAQHSDPRIDSFLSAKGMHSWVGAHPNVKVWFARPGRRY